ncbi:MAG: hypothetical protein MJ016_07135 [Victivallaceae bacterium]|nr:hypothetical protein [Victivallaceae bacterium]
MANYLTDVAAVQYGEAGVSAKLMPNKLGGRVRSIRAEYIPLGTEAAGSVIKIAKLGGAFRLLPESTITVQGGMSDSVTIKVGTAEDDDRYLAAVVCGGTATVQHKLDADRFGGTIENGAEIVATTGGATLTANKKIVFDLLVVQD